MTEFPRVPFVPAEEHVDWRAHQNEIDGARSRVEQRVLNRVRRAAVLIQHHKAAPLAAQKDIAETMRRGLEQTARFGYYETQREIASQRSGVPRTPSTAQPAQHHTVALLALLAALNLDGPRLSPKSLLARLRRRAAADSGGRLRRYAVARVGHESSVALGGWSSVVRVLGERSEAVARDVVSAMLGRHARLPVQAERASVLADLLAEGVRVLHNETLEVVGEALNLGRASGALALEKPPRWAMRSEQLDQATCGPCDTLHGQVVEAGSPEFIGLMPPSGCLGGGRCRGIVVFADEVLALQVAAVAKRHEAA